MSWWSSAMDKVGDAVNTGFDTVVDNISIAFDENPQAELTAVRENQYFNQNKSSKPIYTDYGQANNSHIQQAMMIGIFGLIAVALIAKLLK